MIPCSKKPTWTCFSGLSNAFRGFDSSLERADMDAGVASLAAFSNESCALPTGSTYTGVGIVNMSGDMPAWAGSRGRP